MYLWCGGAVHQMCFCNEIDLACFIFISVLGFEQIDSCICVCPTTDSDVADFSGCFCCFVSCSPSN